MSADPSRSRLAVVALAVSICAMVGTIGNTAFSVWKYHDEKKTLLTVSHEIFPNSTVKLGDSYFPFSFTQDGHMSGPLDSSETPYKKSLDFYIMCRITNGSPKNVTIQDITSGIHFGKNWYIGHPSIFRGLLDKTLSRQTLPRMLVPGEQILYFFDIGWPIDQRTLTAIQSNCKHYESESIEDLYSCLKIKGVDLNNESDGIIPRTFFVHVHTADGKEFRSERKLFEMIIIR